MNFCVIAVKYFNRYKSIICHYENRESLEKMLNERYYNPIIACNLIELGDIKHDRKDGLKAYHRDLGYLWNQTQPVEHSHPKLLLTYFESVGADQLYVFEEFSWDTVENTQDEKLSRGPRLSA